MKKAYDAIVIGAGVVGAATTFHLMKLGCEKVLLLDRGPIGNGGTGKSCAIVRTHYSVPSNTELAVRSLEMFTHFKDVLGDSEAESGFVNTGYLILAPEGETADLLVENLVMQSRIGANTRHITTADARELHPLLQLDDVAAVGYEPESGYADPYLTTASFVNAAKQLGAKFKPNCPVTGLVLRGDTVAGIRTSDGDLSAGAVISAVGPWTHRVTNWLGVDIPLEISRHTVLTMRGDGAYGPSLPIVKDLTTPNKMYFRPTAVGAALVGTGDRGDPIEDPDDMATSPGTDLIYQQGTQLAHRMPTFSEAEVIDSWFGPYDITPDYNPVLGPIPGVEGLSLAFGFSGHGFKLAPMVGRVLAQSVLGQDPDVDISPYRLDRFAEGALLMGAYGGGSIS